MNYYKNLPVFKVVELNNVLANRTGHIIAQAEMAQADFAGGAEEYLPNGYILYLDVDGKLKSPGNVDALVRANQNPVLHYTEELFTGPTTELKHFAVEWNDEDVAYPRGLVLNVGDTFTTDNFTGTLTGATVATVSDNGVFELHVNAAAIITYEGPLFFVEVSTLPDGETDAVELTLLANNVSIA